VTDFFFFLLLS